MFHAAAARNTEDSLSAGCYQRHRPEQTLLYQIVEEYYPAFTAHLAALGRELPGYIRHKFEDYLKCGLLERDAENSYLASEAVDDDPMNQLLGHSVTYRIAVGPQAGRKALTLQTLPACDPEDQCGDTVGKVVGFSLHGGQGP